MRTQKRKKEEKKATETTKKMPKKQKGYGGEKLKTFHDDKAKAIRDKGSVGFSR